MKSGSAIAWSRAGAAGLLLTLAFGCKSSGEDACWGLAPGERMTIKLLERYTPASSFTYESVVVTFGLKPVPLDQTPSCGTDFDFEVGDTLQIQLVSLEEADESLACRASNFELESPIRLGGTFESPQINMLLTYQGVLRNRDAITIDGCKSARDVLVVPQGAYPGSPSDPVVGQVPSYVLVRTAYVPTKSDGVCEVLTGRSAICADQFVIQLNRD